MNKFSGWLREEESHNLIASLLAIVFGMLFGFVIITLVAPSISIKAFSIILRGGFYHGFRGLGNVLFDATPIILTGLSVGFAFKTGLFNIGAAGQFTLGAFVAIYAGVNFTWMPANLGWIVAIILGTLAGALWGLIVGVLKAYRNVNEVISSIMMNYIAMYVVNFLIRSTAYDTTYSRTLRPKYALLPRMGLDKIFVGSSLNIGIFLAIIVAIITYVVLEKTKFGFELKSVGHNRHAARFTGINEKKNIMLSMLIAGGLAGMGGAILYLADVGIYMSTVNVLLPQGFDGIAVALLAQNSPLGIIFSGLFISHISYGGNNLQIFGLQPEIIQVITSTIIYISALSIFIKTFIGKVVSKRDGEIV